jgi:hypothetical protein
VTIRLFFLSFLVVRVVTARLDCTLSRAGAIARVMGAQGLGRLRNVEVGGLGRLGCVELGRLRVRRSVVGVVEGVVEGVVDGVGVEEGVWVMGGRGTQDVQDGGQVMQGRVRRKMNVLGVGGGGRVDSPVSEAVKDERWVGGWRATVKVPST